MASAALAYKVEDRSILLPHYRRFLIDPVLPLIPASVSPNAITHAGHLLNLTGTAMLIALWPTRGWPFIAAMLLVQAYVWCDNADGAHARRTGQCSPLGEFLDHGLDILNVLYIAYLTCMALGLGPMGWVLVVLVIPGAGAATMWEQSHTGVFRLGLLNQVESVQVLSFALTMSGLYGTGIFEQLTIFGVALGAAFLAWCVTQIAVGMIRGMLRVARARGTSALLPLVAYIAFGASVALAAWTGALGTVAAVTIATAANVFFSMRMLSLRLQSVAPRVELVLVVGAFALSAVALWGRMGQPTSPTTGAFLTALACTVLGGSALYDARDGLQRVGGRPAMAGLES